MEQKLHDVRRYPGSHRTRAGAENGQNRRRDPSLYLISMQIFICILLALVGWMAVKTDQPFLDGARERYEELLTGEFETQAARETAARVIERLTEPRGARSAQTAKPSNDVTPPEGGADGGAAPAAEDAAPEISGAADVPAKSAMNMDDASTASFAPPVTDTDEPDAKSGGAGGRMLTALAAPRGDDGRPAPASCSFSPIVVSAKVDPPCSGIVSSEYGYREHPISGADDFHRGLDIATAEGDAVRAALPGRVSEIDSSAIYGNFITLDHGGGLFTTYSHCDAIIAELGANLRQGEMIATVGNTGISTGPHVHFEISSGGKYYDPAWVLDRMSADGD